MTAPDHMPSTFKIPLHQRGHPHMTLGTRLGGRFRGSGRLANPEWSAEQRDFATECGANRSGPCPERVFGLRVATWR
jgi:hypothetical protein